jgi:hypothetical protein
MKKSIFAIPAEATAIPENPSTAARMAIKKNAKAQFNISSHLAVTMSNYRTKACTCLSSCATQAWE